eukprot:TRINITY_DN74636_c0_g1_i1.p1 TRINITY_DN74636_c0_g1~~TRINITY_DN74636_c0_g1_i1.p1  ORF type:complete len:696 (+),score=229.33 TRINITY_DN74636_c0_g1_i1:55-2088(+)
MTLSAAAGFLLLKTVSAVVVTRQSDSKVHGWCNDALDIEDKRESTFNIMLSSKQGPRDVISEAATEEHRYHENLKHVCKTAQSVLDKVSNVYMPKFSAALESQEPPRASKFLAPTAKAAPTLDEKEEQKMTELANEADADEEAGISEVTSVVKALDEKREDLESTQPVEKAKDILKTHGVHKKNEEPKPLVQAAKAVTLPKEKEKQQSEQSQDDARSMRAQMDHPKGKTETKNVEVAKVDQKLEDQIKVDLDDDDADLLDEDEDAEDVKDTTSLKEISKGAALVAKEVLLKSQKPTVEAAELKNKKQEQVKNTTAVMKDQKLDDTQTQNDEQDEFDDEREESEQTEDKSSEKKGEVKTEVQPKQVEAVEVEQEQDEDEDNHDVDQEASDVEKGKVAETSKNSVVQNPYYSSQISSADKLNAQPERQTKKVDAVKLEQKQETKGSEKDVETLAVAQNSVEKGEQEEAAVSFFQISLENLIKLKSIDNIPVSEAKQWCSFFMSTSEDKLQPIAEAKSSLEDKSIRLAAYKVKEDQVAEKIRIRESIKSSWEDDIERLAPILSELSDGDETMRSEAEFAPGSNKELALSIVQEMHDTQQIVVDGITKMRERRIFGVKHQTLELELLRQKQAEMAKDRRHNEDAVQTAEVRLGQSQKKVQKIKTHCLELDRQRDLGLRHDW